MQQSQVASQTVEWPKSQREAILTSLGALMGQTSPHPELQDTYDSMMAKLRVVPNSPAFTETEKIFCIALVAWAGAIAKHRDESPEFTGPLVETLGRLCSTLSHDLAQMDVAAPKLSPLQRNEMYCALGFCLGVTHSHDESRYLFDSLVEKLRVETDILSLSEAERMFCMSALGLTWALLEVRGSGNTMGLRTVLALFSRTLSDRQEEHTPAVTFEKESFPSKPQNGA